MTEGEQHNGYKIDIWSTGIILYFMLNGYLPFEDGDGSDLNNKIMECKIIIPKFINKDAQYLLGKILVIDPEKRIDINNIKKHPFYLKGKEIP